MKMSCFLLPLQAPYVVMLVMDCVAYALTKSREPSTAMPALAKMSHQRRLMNDLAVLLLVLRR